jgi:hypothetical protein
MRTHPLATSPLITPVYPWTFCGVTDPLQDGGLSSVGSSNNEHAEREIVLHSGIVLGQPGCDLTHPSVTMATRRLVSVRGLKTSETVGAGDYDATGIREPM